MKKLLSATAVIFLLGCGSGDQNNGTSNEGGKGTGASGQGGSGAGSAQGGAGGTGAGTSDGGAGGASAGGGGAAPEACVPGEYSLLLTFIDKSVATSEPCALGPLGPDAYLFYPKGGAPSFIVNGCSGPGEMPPKTSLTTDLAAAGTSTVAVTYTDGSAIYFAKDASITIDTFGDVFEPVTGTMEGILFSDGGDPLPMTGSFNVCRRPDLLAP